MFPLNPRLAGLQASPTLALNELCGALKKEGKPVYRLGFGQSPFPVPECVVEALRTNAHQKAYLPVKGLAELRNAVAGFNRRTLGIACDGEDVLIGPGSKELMFLLQLVTDADLVVPSPAWVSYIPQATLLGRSTVRVPTHATQRFAMNPDTLDQVLSESKSPSRLLVLNSPGNPTGTAYGKDELEALARVAAKHNILILSDEIYGELHHHGKHHSIAAFYPEGTIVSSGLSKWCGAGGWRLGTLTFPKNLRPLLNAVAVAGSETFSATSSPIQYASVRAFEGNPEITDYVTRSRDILRGLGQWIHHRLESSGVACLAPQGGFYLFPDFSGRSSVADSTSFCTQLLKETGVALLPGECFGRPPQELTTRLAYVDFDGEKAIHSSGAITPDWLRGHCAPVLEGVDRLIEWLN